MALVASDVVPAVLGDKWSFMVGPLQVLAAYASVRSITPIASQALLVIGDTRFQMYLAAAAAIALPAGFYVGSHWGAIGIAVAWTIVHPTVVYVPFSVRFSRRLGVSLSMYLKALWPALSGCLAMSAAVVAVRTLMPDSSTHGMKAAVEVAAGAVVYTACLFMFFRPRLERLRAAWRHRAA